MQVDLPVNSRYSNVERELIAVFRSREKFNHASTRLQSPFLKMKKYNVKLRYIQGKTNLIADALSSLLATWNPSQKIMKYHW